MIQLTKLIGIDERFDLAGEALQSNASVQVLIMLICSKCMSLASFDIE